MLLLLDTGTVARDTGVMVSTALVLHDAVAGVVSKDAGSSVRVQCTCSALFQLPLWAFRMLAAQGATRSHA